MNTAALTSVTGLSLAWSPGTTEPARADAEALGERWRATWPRVVAMQRDRRASIVLETRSADGSEPGILVGLLGEPRALGAALADFSRECRTAHDMASWTSGWPRDVERELARGEALRRRRQRARSS